MQNTQRTHFSESTHNDFFTVNGLQSSTGQTSRDFGNVVLKELIDNALDACESADIEPRINVAVEMTGNNEMVLTVSDNGAGLDGAIVEKILDFDTRTSDKAAYKSPTRGAQGNALKTILGIPTALGGGLVTIESKGLRHEISFNVSQSGLTVETLHNVTPISESIGTTVKVLLPKLYGTKPAYWVQAFALFNSHCWVNFESKFSMVNRDSSKPVFYPKLTDCKKITPDKPTNAHSYRNADFYKLTAMQGEQTKTTVYEFVRTFDGLTSKLKAKQIIDELNLNGKRVADIFNDRAKVTALHSAMKLASKPIQHKHLGAIGESNLLARLENVTRNAYRKIEGVIEGVPYVFEILIADCNDTGGLFYGVNHSPTYSDFLSGCSLWIDSKYIGYGIDGALRGVVDTEKYTVICHLIGIGLNFKDKGKSSLDLPDSVTSEIAAAVVQVAKSIKRDSSNIVRFEGETPPQKVTIKDAVFAVLNDAIAKSTDNGRLYANVRNVFYKARELAQLDKPLEYNYFSQTIVPEYWQQHGRNRQIYNDARGMLYEPHSDKFLPLGTIEVDGYELPEFQYDKILYIEKKGLWHTVKSAGLHKKYDMAVIAGEGFASVAIRELLDRAQAGSDYTIFVLHDADSYGYNIARTLQAETARMPNHKITVIDLGLFVQDALDIGIEPETHDRKTKLTENLTNLNAIEREYFEGVPKGKTFECKRIELNALTANQLIDYIDGGIARAIAENGLANKIVPPEIVLTDTANQLRHDKLMHNVKTALIEKYGIEQMARQIVESITIENTDLTNGVIDYLQANELMTWRDSLNDLTDKQIAANQGAIDDKVKA